ncbi:hypothetical protein B9Q03_04835 [Candidatus Marsarchaeota G2 archaeon OSP_D]|uniref:Uncharacterized protein n=4 Tax=Candidatus Marsarchaeota group 2 TaxID=2203771 RepID=A0A2R6BBC6_9ARCH|nr:MAG: hypothetical protein B9Q03_04835 [Candidatus Marsarchaeota G2 archaeon OSP_D]PSN93939.1 MAG: hypothetical protein B9Q09_04970 [Candidatus Marsarchaeota G2 archaeon ECH_B_SAG-C16]PSN95960.1 MAG: hypothetical protein B9Q06_03870 [Candidatus Marsarchaeota G2 archaeon ECH_B_2]PSO02538.1 MAG: hypothetical protein B9Q05_04630 [Candidatus Marsarchaeota G2 archaeon ECH_B_1]
MATVGLGLYALNPELGLLIMCASVLFEVDSEGTVYHSVLASRLRGALVKMGVNRPTATVICEGLFDPKSGSGAAYLSSGDYKIRAKSEYASKMLILENVVLLISGLSTVGLLTCYIITYIYGGSRLATALFGVVPYTVFIARFFVSQRTGRFMRSRLAEAFSIALIALFLATNREHIALIPLLGFGMGSIYTLYTREIRRRGAERREKAFFVALMKALGNQGLAAKAKVVRLTSEFGSLRVADLSYNPSVPSILEHISTKMVRSDHRVILGVFGKALSALGYRPSWFRASWSLLRVSERLESELSQQLAKNVLVASVMFSMSALSITLLTGTAFFKFSSGSLLGVLPTLSLDAGYLGFSYIYKSETLYEVLLLTLLVGELALRYSI